MQSVPRFSGQLGPYEIVTPLGAGGMGEVYKARDKRLGREVAVKILSADKVADSDRRQRFIREARAASLLNHPNIITIYDIAEAEGVHFIVMEYVAGKTLANSIPMAREAALHCARQIASAVAKAHAAGIIHRDLKPANIMLTNDGTVKVLDFGLAKLEEPGPRRESDLTQTAAQTQAGMILGTVSYMSPEQAEGKPVDARSDIFSFGLVLYEMLSGRQAFLGDTPVSTMAAILHKDPQPLREAAPELERIVARCLRKESANRFQTMAEVQRALEDVASGKLTAAPEPVPSIAVLPFANLSADKENEYFSDGLAEEIINALTKLPDLKVTARTSAFAFKAKNEDVRRIAEALGVAHILEGSVRKAGNRIRVTAQLINAADGNHLWSDRYDREMNDIFAIQDEISQAIVDVLKLKLAGKDAPMVRRQTVNMEAYQACLEGRHYVHQTTASSMARSRECYERAIQLDPQYALPHAGLAEHHFYSAMLLNVRPREVLPKLLAAVEQALKLDPSAAEAYTMRGMYHAVYEFNWPSAGADFDRALELNPNFAMGRYRRANWYLRPLGRLDEALAEMDRARELDPLSPLLQFGTAYGLHASGRGEQAEKQARSMLDLFPNYWVGCWLSGLIFAQRGLFEEATKVVENGLRINPDSPWLLSALAVVFGRHGKRQEAAGVLAQLEALSAVGYVSPYSYSLTYASIGDIDKACEWLDNAIEERDPLTFIMSSDPLMSDYRPHPRYQAVLRKMNLTG